MNHTLNSVINCWAVTTNTQPNENIILTVSSKRATKNTIHGTQVGRSAYTNEVSMCNFAIDLTNSVS